MGCIFSERFINTINLLNYMGKIKNKKMKIIKSIIIMFVFVMTLNSVFSASIFNVGCWFNDNPNLKGDLLIYNSTGSFKSSVTFDSMTTPSLVLEKGDIIKADLSRTTDNQNNINNERIFFLNDVRNDFIIKKQNNNNILTTLSSNIFSSTKFDFYNYLTGGTMSKPQYFQENTNLIPYNNGNPQIDMIETYQLNDVGNYEMLFRTSDSCANPNGQDEVYKFITLKINPKQASLQNSFNCNNVTTISSLYNNKNVDINISNGCNNIILNSINANINIINNQNISNKITINHNQGNIINYLNGGLDIYNVLSNFNFISTQNFYAPMKSFTSNKVFSPSMVLNNINLIDNNKNITTTGQRVTFGGNVNGNFNYNQSPFVLTFDNLFNSNINLSYFSMYAGMGGITFHQSNGLTFGIYKNNNFNINGNGLELPFNVIEFNNNVIDNINHISTPQMISNPNNIYLNTFKFTGNSIVNDGGNGGSITLGHNFNGHIVGNTWLNGNNTDMFSCNTTISSVNINNKNINVCDNPISIISGYTNIYDYIIVTNLSTNLSTNSTIVNSKPVAILNISPNTQVDIGTSICWDSSSSFDSDGTIISKTIQEGNNITQNLDSNCLVSNVPKIMKLELIVTDNNNASSTTTKYLKWSKSNVTCASNTPPSLVLSNSNVQGNYYWLNATGTDVDGDTLTYSWSVNGNIIDGKDILQNIDYTQDVYGSVFDGCDLTANTMNINVGINQTINQSVTPIVVDMICSKDNIYPNAQVNCNLIYDLKGHTLSSITWNYDNQISNTFNGTNFSKLITDTNNHLISSTLTTLNGDVKTNYYSVNLINQPQINNGGGNNNNNNQGGGGGSGGTVKTNCDIVINPNPVEITNSNNLIQVNFKNNEIGSWTPDYKFSKVIGENSSMSRLSISNVFGTFNSKQNKNIGIKYTPDLFNQNSISTRDNLILSSSSCRDIIIPIIVNISNVKTINFATLNNNLLSDIQSGNIFTSSIVSKKLLPNASDVTFKLKNWHLVVLVLMLFSFVFWDIKYSRNPLNNVIIKTSIIGLTTTFTSIVLIMFIRYIIGKF